MFYEDLGIDTSKTEQQQQSTGAPPAGGAGAAVFVSASAAGTSSDRQQYIAARAKTMMRMPVMVEKSPLRQPLLTEVDVTDDGPGVTSSAPVKQAKDSSRGRAFSQFSVSTTAADDPAPAEPDYTCWEHIASYCFCCLCCPSRQ